MDDVDRIFTLLYLPAFNMGLLLAPGKDALPTLLLMNLYVAADAKTSFLLFLCCIIHRFSPQYGAL